MRLRLFLSFTVVVLISIASLLLVIRQTAIQEVRTFMFRGGMAGLEGVVAGLENYYAINQTWAGAGHLLEPSGQNSGSGRGNRGGQQGFGGMMAGMMNQRIRLADADGNLVLDTEDAEPMGSLGSDVLQGAIPLRMGRDIVGYLLPEGGMVFSSGDDVALIDRLTRAAYIAAGVAIVFALILAILLSNRLLRPIRALTQAADTLVQPNGLNFRGGRGKPARNDCRYRSRAAHTSGRAAGSAGSTSRWRPSSFKRKHNFHP
jgi:hypothetical protein